MDMLIVDGERRNCRAMDRRDKRLCRPRDISSRSAKVKASLDRLRCAGRMPPVRDNSG